MPNILSFVNKSTGEVFFPDDIKHLSLVDLKRSYRRKVDTTFTKPSKTKQSFAAESNINNIMAKYAKTGLLTHVNKYGGDYGDFSNFQDYQSSLSQLQAAQDAFDSLPAKLRKFFDNDPGSFVDFVSDPQNAPRMIDLGLAKPLANAEERESHNAGVAASPGANPPPKASLKPSSD